MAKAKAKGPIDPRQDPANYPTEMYGWYTPDTRAFHRDVIRADNGSDEGLSDLADANLAENGQPIAVYKFAGFRRVRKVGVILEPID